MRIFQLKKDTEQTQKADIIFIVNSLSVTVNLYGINTLMQTS